MSRSRRISIHRGSARTPASQACPARTFSRAIGAVPVSAESVRSSYQPTDGAPAHDWQPRGESHSLSVTVILDVCEDVCRIGDGDVRGLKELQKCSKMKLRMHPGVRLGLLVADKVVAIWSPTPRSVDGETEQDEPNAIVRAGGILEGPIDGCRVESAQHKRTQHMAELGHARLADQLTKSLAEDHVGENCIQAEEIPAVEGTRGQSTSTV